MLKTYYEQFRDNQREKNQNGVNSQSKGKTNGKLPSARATAVKRSPRSDTFILPTKRQTVDPKVSKTKPAPNPPRRMPSLPRAPVAKNPTPPIQRRRPEPVAKNPTPPPQRRRLEPVQRNGSTRPAPRYPSSSVEQEELGRRPVRFADRPNPAYRSSSPPPPPPPPPPVRHQKPARVPREISDRSRHVRVADQDYIIEHRRDTPVEYVYDDYYTVRDLIILLTVSPHCLSFLVIDDVTIAANNCLIFLFTTSDVKKREKSSRLVFC